MTNIIGYNQLPEKNEFIDLYVNQNKLQRELAEIYGCGKVRIRKWIKYFNLSLRSRGAGNNKKYDVSKEELQYLINQNYTREQISDTLNMSKSNVNKLLCKYNIRKEKNTTEYQNYARKVRHLTESNYAKYNDIINPNKYPRTLCGVTDGYQLDHILGIRECFDKGLSIEDCADIKNLQMIPWQKNLQKRKWGIKNEKR